MSPQAVDSIPFSEYLNLVKGMSVQVVEDPISQPTIGSEFVALNTALTQLLLSR
jgi:hypothetical protein